MNFLPNEYEVPQSGGQYVKLKQGENRLRILAPPIIGWEDWDKSGETPKPIRYKMNEKETIKVKDKLKHFWAMIVYDYSDNRIKIWEVTQTSIQNPIQALSKDVDWGTPLDYDLNINKKGESLDTEYLVNPKPKTELSPEIKELFNKTPVWLDALYDGLDPFDATIVPDFLK